MGEQAFRHGNHSKAIFIGQPAVQAVSSFNRMPRLRIATFPTAVSKTIIGFYSF